MEKENKTTASHLMDLEEALLDLDAFKDILCLLYSTLDSCFSSMTKEGIRDKIHSIGRVFHQAQSNVQNTFLKVWDSYSEERKKVIVLSDYVKGVDNNARTTSI